MMNEEFSEISTDNYGLETVSDADEHTLIAENKTVISPELFHDAFMLTFNKKPKSQILGIGIFCTIVGIICLLLQLYNGKINIFWIPFLCMGVYSLIHGFRLTKTTEQRRYKVLTAKKAGVPDDEIINRKISFYERHMEILLPDGQNVIKDYCDVTDIREGEKSLVFVMEDKSAVIIEKAGFTSGDVETVKQEIKKCNE